MSKVKDDFVEIVIKFKKPQSVTDFISYSHSWVSFREMCDNINDYEEEEVIIFSKYGPGWSIHILVRSDQVFDIVRYLESMMYYGFVEKYTCLTKKMMDKDKE